LPGEANPKPRTAKGQLLEDRHRADVENRTSELMELGMNDDTNSLHTILSELNNPDPEIRQAALDATIQFGSTNAIPGLEAAALWNDNPEEKKQIADAIEFLKLPQLGDPAFPITGSSKGPARKPLRNRNRLGAAK
jgi:HEAT repeat protein